MAWEVVQPPLPVNVSVCFGDRTSRDHRVGFGVRSIHPRPAALTAHPDALILAEAGDVPGQYQPTVALDRPCLGQNQ
jgi:hypothetical protein